LERSDIREILPRISLPLNAGYKLVAAIAIGLSAPAHAAEISSERHSFRRTAALPPT
jgi:hypothetical protein